MSILSNTEHNCPIEIVPVPSFVFPFTVDVVKFQKLAEPFCLNLKPYVFRERLQLFLSHCLRFSKMQYWRQ